jgi:hypothetical protein
VKGVAHHQARTAMAAGTLKAGASITLLCDPLNPHDPDAVAIFLAATHQKLGHISKHHCGRVGKLIRDQKFRSARVAKVSGAAPMEVEILVAYDVPDEASPLVAVAPVNDLLASTVRSLPAEPGVYKITNQATGWIYVGSSSSLRGRAHDHARDLRAGNHANTRLQSDFAIYGGARFAFSLVCGARDGRQAEILEARCIAERLAAGKVLLYNATTDGRGIKGASAANSSTRNGRPFDRAAIASFSERPWRTRSSFGGKTQKAPHPTPDDPVPPSTAPALSKSPTAPKTGVGRALTGPQALALLVLAVVVVALALHA